MAGRYLKHILLFFLTASVIVGAAEEYKEEDYVKLCGIDYGSYWTVSKVREKKTGKIYALKTFTPGPGGYGHAAKEINALEQLDHKNVIKMIANSLGARSKEDPIHIVLEHMPCDLDAALRSHPETKENIRKILYQLLSGV
ncbi:MAG: CMGC/CDK protein kinase, partial [Amphiamblys sp. WSBS2006]